MTNRIIKFRVWSKKDSKFGYIELTDGGEGKPHIRMPKPHITYGTNNVVYQQYTGLKDRHGKEIYEGDILEFKGRKPGEHGIGEVEYVIDQTSLRAEWQYGSIGWYDSECEIIGNIYEDSHLLSEDPNIREGAK